MQGWQAKSQMATSLLSAIAEYKLLTVKQLATIAQRSVQVTRSKLKEAEI